MNEKRLRKISKKELLEILLSQAKRIEELENELEKTQKKLNTKKIIIEESGTLAEAALKLNNIFEVAQEAADQYLLNIKEKCKKEESNTKKTSTSSKNKAVKITEKRYKQKVKKTNELSKNKEKVEDNSHENVVVGKPKKIFVD